MGVGLGVTVTVAIAVPVPTHGAVPTVQVAVYEVVVVGLPVLAKPVVPSFQLTAPAQFDTVKVADCPAQIVGLLTVGVDGDFVV